MTTSSSNSGPVDGDPVQPGISSTFAGDSNSKAESRAKWREVNIPLLSLLVALSGVLSSTVVQVVSLQTQASLKQYEVTFITKQKAYADLLSSMHEVFYLSDPARTAEMFQSFDKLTSIAFAIHPFLTPEQQTTLDEDIRTYIGFCISREKGIRGGQSDMSVWTKAFVDQTEKVRLQLSTWLFAEVTK